MFIMIYFETERDQLPFVNGVVPSISFITCKGEFHQRKTVTVPVHQERMVHLNEILRMEQVEKPAAKHVIS